MRARDPQVFLIVLPFGVTKVAEEIERLNLAKLEAEGQESQAQRPISAHEVVEVVAERIQSFEKALGQGEKLVIVLVTGDRLTIEEFRAHGRGVIEIVGRDSERRSCSILQHFSQISLVLRATKLDTGEQRKPIGFGSATS